MKGGIPVTTDYILCETITLLRARTDAEGVKVFIDTILDAIRKERVSLQRIDDKRWQKTWDLCKKHSDKPGISFTDFSSMAVMKENNIKEILTNDKHFENVGMGFAKLF